jgi:hypothetical protein
MNKYFVDPYVLRDFEFIPEYFHPQRVRLLVGEPFFCLHLLDAIDAVCDSCRIPPLRSLGHCFNNFRSNAICVIAYLSDFKWQTPGLLLLLTLLPMSLHNYHYG